LGASASFTGALYLTNRWMKATDGRTRSWLTLGVSALAILAMALPTGSFALPDSMTGWLALAWLTTAYGVAITLLLTVLPKPGVSRHAAALNFEPIAVLAMGWAILGQSVKPLQIVGAFVVIGAVILLSSARK
jgi:drug/metabolite transporter (DMT)-like permease